MRDEAQTLQRMTLFRQRCGELGLANTHQRQVIFRTLAESTNHPTPEEVYRKVCTKIPSISLGTVYKNIKIFVRAGLLKEVALRHEPLRLDPNLTNHHHLICGRCKSITDLAAEHLEPVRFKGKPPAGFKVEHCEAVAYGLCAVCVKKHERSL